MTAQDVGAKLYDCCRRGAFSEAIDSLYADDIVSVEPFGDENMPPEMRGLAQIREKNAWWTANHEVHSCEVGGPYPHGDRFALTFALDLTAKAGPGAGQRMQMSEVALYTVRDGKIAREEFFYARGG